MPVPRPLEPSRVSVPRRASGPARPCACARPRIGLAPGRCGSRRPDANAPSRGILSGAL